MSRLGWLRHPLRAANRRIEAWVTTRVQRVPGPVAINRRRVYILPTRQGIVFAVMLLAMLLGAMNYSNSMAFALTFLLGGLGLVCMHHTHGNLVNLEIGAGRASPVFVGETAEFSVHLHNPSQRPRFALAAGFSQGDAIEPWVDADAGDSGTLLLPVAAKQRGWVKAPRFSVSTDFPLGLFHAWTWAELDMQTLAYPQPAGASLTPPAVDDEGETLQAHRRGDDEFSGVRAYARGDAMSAVHWKASARTGELVVKQFASTAGEDLVLDFDSLGSLGVEARLSQLCRWVLDAHSLGQPWKLRLPGQTLGPALGEAHLNASLRALALHGRPADA